MNVERQSPGAAGRASAGRAVALTGEPAEPRVRTAAVPAAEVLVGLAAFTGPPDWRPGAAGRPPRPLSAALRAALRRVGPDPAEVWLHLLGLAVEAPEPRDGAALVAALDRAAPDELLRHALGYYVPAWRAYVDGEVIAAAAAGDRAAQRSLLSQPRYYAGQARPTLRRLLRLGAPAAAEVLREAVRGWYAEVAAGDERRVAAALDRSVARARALLAGVSTVDAIEEVTGGYRHTPEPGIDGVLLLPQLAMRPHLLLCQHRNERICGYPVAEEDLAGPVGPDLTGRVLRVLGALHDEQRLEIVRMLASGPATLHELADRLGLAKSTVHHHIGRLRLGGLVTLSRNPDRSYSYALRPAGFAALPTLLDELVSPPTGR